MADSSEVIRLNVTGSEKDERKDIHVFLKKYFPHLTSDGAKKQMDDPEQKYIALSYIKTDRFQTRMGDDDDKVLCNNYV